MSADVKLYLFIVHSIAKLLSLQFVHKTKNSIHTPRTAILYTNQGLHPRQTFIDSRPSNNEYQTSTENQIK